MPFRPALLSSSALGAVNFKRVLTGDWNSTSSKNESMNDTDSYVSGFINDTPAGMAPVKEFEDRSSSTIAVNRLIKLGIGPESWQPLRPSSLQP